MARAAKVVTWAAVTPGREVLYKGELRRVERVEKHPAGALLVHFRNAARNIGLVHADTQVAVLLTPWEKANFVDRIREAFRGW